MNVRFTLRALAEAKCIKAWWIRNRPAAPDLFDRDLATVLDLIQGVPCLGSIYASRKQVEIRRVLLPKTSNHVYYAVGPDEIVVLSIWGTPRERGSKL